MDWFQGSSEVGSHSSHHRRQSSSRHDKHDSKHESRSIFNGLGSPKHHSSRSSFFGFGTGRSSSYYKRSPREGYLRRIYHKLRRLLRDLIHFMKRHPMKVFMLVIMPLLTGGALTKLLGRFGVRLPAGLDKMFGSRGGGSMGYDQAGGTGPLAALGGLSNLAGGLGGLGGVAGMAKMFL